VKQWKNFRAADLFGAFLLLLALGALLFAAALKVIAQSPPNNAAPVANAGPDQTVILPDQAILRGWAVDDVLPNPPDTLIYEWSVISGPDAVTFGNAAAASTTGAFTSEGTYMLQLTASDGELSGEDTVVVTVYAAPSPPPNTGKSSLTSSVLLAGRGAIAALLRAGDIKRALLRAEWVDADNALSSSGRLQPSHLTLFPQGKPRTIGSFAQMRYRL